MSRVAIIVAICVATGLLGDLASAQQAASSPKGDPAPLDEMLKPLPPKSPPEALETFEVHEGFELQLVAHEPLVTDPICAAFDENGLLYVAEMRGYPYRPTEGQPPLGRIRVLDYFHEAKAALSNIRAAGGQPAPAQNQ